MEIPSKDAISRDFSVHLPSDPSLPCEGGFISHRPMSAGIDSITQGFRFAASGRKPSMVVGDASTQEKARGTCREMNRNNDTVTSKKSEINTGMSRLDANELLALKVSVPVFPPIPLSLPQNNLLQLPLSPQGSEVSTINKGMLPPSLAPHPSRRGRSNIIVKERRKRVHSPSSLEVASGNRDQSNHESMLVKTDGGHGYLEGSREAVRIKGRKEGISRERTSSDGRGPKRKRQEKPIGPPRSQNFPSIIPPQSENRGTEVIILDDDIKVELFEINAPVPRLQRGNPNRDHDMDMAKPVRGLEQYLQRGKPQVHTYQSKKHPTYPKDSNHSIDTRPNTTNESVNSSSLCSGIGAVRTNDQPIINNRSNMNHNGILDKNAYGDIGQDIGNPSQHLSPSSALSSPIIPTSSGEQGESSTGEHKLLIALTTLTTEKQSLENKLQEAIASAKIQVFQIETLAQKNAKLEIQVKTYEDTVLGLKKKMLGVQKFVEGLGKDYDMLNEKKIQLSNRLNELSHDRSGLIRSIDDVRSLVDKFDRTVQEWRSSGAVLKEAYREIEKLNETLKFLHTQLSENAGLLSVERDRTQSLECQIQHDREINKSVLTAIHDGKIQILARITEARGVVGEKDGLDLMEKLAEAQQDIETKIEVNSEATRSFVHGYFKSLEKLSDRNIDAAQDYLYGVEKRVDYTSDSIIGLFHETHKMNAEALSFTDSYISHLGSMITGLETELKEMHEKYEILLVTSAEKEQLRKELELKLEIALKRCNELSGQADSRSITENALNESISSLKQKLFILETESMKDSSMFEATSILKKRNHDLEKECELARNNFQDASLSLQIKAADLEKLRTDLESLTIKYNKSQEAIEKSVKERAEFIAHAEEQKMKERIEVETNANMFRQRETSRLNNQIKALEAQKGKLEIENKELKAVAVHDADVAITLKKEISKSNKKYTDIEKSHLELLQDKIRLENMVNHLTELGSMASTSYFSLEKISKTTTDELSIALEKINILQSNKDLMLQEINAKEELGCAKAKLPTITEDDTVLQIAGRGLGAALQEAENGKILMAREESTIHVCKVLEEKTKALERALEVFRGAEKSPNTLSNSYEELEPLKNEADMFEGDIEGATKGSSGIPGKILAGKMGIELSPHTLGKKEQILEGSCMATEALATPWENSSSLSPLSSPGCIFETQIEHDIRRDSPKTDISNFEYSLSRDDNATDTRDPKDPLMLSRTNGCSTKLLGFPVGSTSLVKGIKKNSHDSQPRKNLATKVAPHRRPPSMVLYNDGDDDAMIEDFSDGVVTGMDFPMPRDISPEKINPTPGSLRPRAIEKKYEKNGKRLDIARSTSIKRYSTNPTTPPVKPKSSHSSRIGLVDEDKKAQYRTRRERTKKNKDYQEWVEDDGELLWNNKGKEEVLNAKNLKSYKDRKKRR